MVTRFFKNSTFRPMLVIAALSSFVVFSPSAPAQGSTKGQGTGSKADSSDTTNASGKAQNSKSDTPGSSQYFVEADMLAYEASARIATEIAVELGPAAKPKIVLYDQQSFANLEAYSGFRELVLIIENGYKAAKEESAVEPAPTPGVGLLATDIPGMVKTAVDILGALRSTTDLASQKTDPQENALFAQVAQALTTKEYKVIIPKLILLEQPVKPEQQVENSGDKKEPPATSETPKKSSCAAISNTVAQALSCLLGERARAEAESKKNTEKLKPPDQDASGMTNPILTQTNNLLDQLLTSLIASSGKSQAASTTKGKLAPDTTSTQPAGGGSQTSAPSLLSSIISGHRLRTALDDDSKVLYVGFNAAGGSYRVLHNFWLELFYRTPTPAFNGGAVVSYILFNPENSTVEKAQTLRYMYKYSKFKAKKLTAADNFSVRTSSGK